MNNMITVQTIQTIAFLFVAPVLLNGFASLMVNQALALFFGYIEFFIIGNMVIQQLFLFPLSNPFVEFIEIDVENRCYVEGHELGKK